MKNLNIRIHENSNIIIYAAKPKFKFLRKLIAEHTNYISAVSKLEVLGFHKLKKNELKILTGFFNAANA